MDPRTQSSAGVRVCSALVRSKMSALHLIGEKVMTNNPDAQQRHVIREQMNWLAEMSNGGNWGCPEIEELMLHFGAMIAEQANTSLVSVSDKQRVQINALAAIAAWAHDQSFDDLDGDTSELQLAFEYLFQCARDAQKAVEARPAKDQT